MSTVNQHFEYVDGHLYRKRSGKRCGTLRPDGYIQVSMNGRLFLAHRLIFELHHGRKPGLIDHINRDRSDNRIENLRECSTSQNLANMQMRPSSAAKNVSWNKRVQKWHTRVRKDNKVYCGGYHAELSSAIAEATEMRARLHGEFARHA